MFIQIDYIYTRIYNCCKRAHQRVAISKIISPYSMKFYILFTRTHLSACIFNKIYNQHTLRVYPIPIYTCCSCSTRGETSHCTKRMNRNPARSTCVPSGTPVRIEFNWKSYINKACSTYVCVCVCVSVYDKIVRDASRLRKRRRIYL